MPAGRVASLLTAGSAVLLAALLPGSSTATSTATLTVRIDAHDFFFEMSRSSVPAGSTVRYVIRNRGNAIHDFVVKGRRTQLLKPRQSQAITVKFPRKGSFRFLCSVSGHARLGMKGTFAHDRRSPHRHRLRSMRRMSPRSPALERSTDRCS